LNFTYSFILILFHDNSILTILTEIILFLLACSFLFILLILLIRYKDVLNTKKLNSFSEKYSESFFNYVGSDQTPDVFLSKIPKRDADILLKFIQDYFQSLSGKELISLQKLVNNSWLFNLLSNDLKSKSKKRILRAIYFSGVSKNQNLKPQIAEFLSKKDLHIFYQAARSLGRMNALDYSERILAGASLHKKISQDALVSIFLEFKPEVCRYLLNRIHIEEVKLQITIVRIFRHFNFRDAASELQKILAGTKNKNLIIEVIKYAGQIECLSAIETIREYLNHPNSEIRSESIKALAKIGGDVESELISQKIYDTSSQVQIDTADALSKLKPNGLQLLTKVAESKINQRAVSIAKMTLNEIQIESLK
jgi:hypothetical protein